MSIHLYWSSGCGHTSMTVELIGLNYVNLIGSLKSLSLFSSLKSLPLFGNAVGTIPKVGLFCYNPKLAVAYKSMFIKSPILIKSMVINPFIGTSLGLPNSGSPCDGFILIMQFILAHYILAIVVVMALLFIFTNILSAIWYCMYYMLRYLGSIIMSITNTNIISIGTWSIIILFFMLYNLAAHANIPCYDSSDLANALHNIIGAITEIQGIYWNSSVNRIAAFIGMPRDYLGDFNNFIYEVGHNFYIIYDIFIRYTHCNLGTFLAELSFDLYHLFHDQLNYLPENYLDYLKFAVAVLCVICMFMGENPFN